MDDQERYISTPEAAKRFNLERTYAAKLAREAKKQGNPFPIKRGKSWEAPEEEWAKIFHPTSKKIRKPRPEVKKKKSYSKPDKGISCTKAAQRYGISPSWASRLVGRAKERGYEWPKKSGYQWIAPYDNWVEIFEDPLLRAWKRKNN